MFPRVGGRGNIPNEKPIESCPVFFAKSIDLSIEETLSADRGVSSSKIQQILGDGGEAVGKSVPTKRTTQSKSWASLRVILFVLQTVWISR